MERIMKERVHSVELEDVICVTRNTAKRSVLEALLKMALEFEEGRTETWDPEGWKNYLEGLIQEDKVLEEQFRQRKKELFVSPTEGVLQEED